MTKMTVRMSAILLLAAGMACGPSAQTGESGRTVTEAQYEQWKTDLSNWGRWGADDEIGALNLVTPAKRLQAVAVVQDGFTVSLAGDANTVEAVDNPYPYEHEMVSISSDRIAVQYHGISHTHLDALAHINDDGVFYNGYAPDAEAVTERGHEKNSIHNLKSGIVTRGILIDVPRLKGVPYLEPGTPIYVEDLETWEEQAGVRVIVRRRAVPTHGRLAPPGRRGQPLGVPADAPSPAAARPGCTPRSSPWLNPIAVTSQLLVQRKHPTYVSTVGCMPGAVHDFALLVPGRAHVSTYCDLEALARGGRRAQPLGSSC